MKALVTRTLLALSVLFVSPLALGDGGEESWQLVTINGADAGYVMVQTETVGTEAEPLIQTTNESLFRIKRMGQTIEIGQTSIVREDRAGRTREIESISAMAQAETIYRGVVRDDLLEFTIQTVGNPRESSIDWPDDVPGPEETRRRILATGFRTGASVTFWQFEFSLGEPVEATVTVVGQEDVEIDGETRRLYKLTTSVDVAGLPDVSSWVDLSGETLKTSTALMGIRIDTVAADRERVLPFLLEGSDAAAEVFMQSTITANVRLPRPRSLDAITYRIAPKTESATLPDLSSDRQRYVSEPDPNGARTLVIEKLTPPRERRQRIPIAGAGPELAEFLEPNAMLQSDDEELAAFAGRVVGSETDPWLASIRLERAVYELIDKKSLDVAFASALETFRTGEGDCSEHAVLLATLARAAGVPSRVAMGLVYVGGIFGGHAWTEVQIDGRWYALDGTIGRGSVDPTHIEMGTSSLKDGGFSAGLLGTLAGLGNIELEILQYTLDGTTTRIGEGRQRSTVEDGRFIDYVEGVSFDVPEGWRVAPGEPDVLEMSNRFEVAELTRADETGARMLVVARQVPYDFTLEGLRDFIREEAHGEIEELMAEVSGHPAIRLSFADASSNRYQHVGFIVADTLYMIEAEGLGNEDDDALERVVTSLKIE